MKNKKIAILGWNGKKNVGDDAMTSALINFVLKENPDAKFFLAGNGNSLAKYTSSLDENKRVVGQKFYNLFTRLKGVRFFYRRNILPKLIARNTPDLILIGGGSIIHNPANSKNYIAVIKESLKANKNLKVGFIGISVGPFKGEKSETLGKGLLSLADFIVVRDSRSFELIQKFNLKNSYQHAPDLALTLPRLINLKINKTKKELGTVGVSLRIGHVTDEKLRLLVSAVEILFGKYKFKKIKIFNFCSLGGQDDNESSLELMKRLPKQLKEKTEVIGYSYDPSSFYLEINTCQLMLCMRLHASIIAYSMKTSFLILPYHQKCIDFGKEVAQLGDESFLFDNEEQENIENKINSLLKKPNQQFLHWEEVVDKSFDQFQFLDSL